MERERERGGGRDRWRVESMKEENVHIFILFMYTSYESVSFLECDVGQCEFTVSGLVSLHCIKEPVHGPSFVHQRPPEK